MTRVAIIGTGLIGASLGMALRTVGEVTAVVGYDHDPEQLATATRRGAVDAAADALAAAVADADVVVLGVPAKVMAPLVASLGDTLRPGTVVTDVASVKRDVVADLERAVPAGVHVVGGHPMAGSHERGAEHATGDLFVGATYLLTPTPQTDADAYRTVNRLIGAIGARVLAVDPEAHDLLVAVVSHLPQLTATTLMNLAAERARRQHAGLLLLAAGGFRDATRVAASNPQMWIDICRENRDAIVAVLDEYSARIGQLRMALFEGDFDRITALLTDAREARRSLPGKESVTGQLVELHVAIPDRPGALAELFTTIGEVGVNVEDFGVEHAPEGGRGSVRLAVMSFERAERARAALEAKGYAVVERAS